VSAPARASGSTALAGLIAAVIFACVLSVETQSFAAHVGYSSILGKPLIARLYFPGDTLFWMLRFDYGFDSQAITLAWVHAWFRAQRIQLQWAAGIDFAVFMALTFVLGFPGRSDVHGAARWATARDLRRSSLLKSEYGIVLAQTQKRFGRIGELLVHGGAQNVLGIGPPGEGKTDGVAAPTLLKSWLYWSAIVFDPAAELSPLTAEARKAHSRVLVFDPRDPGSACFNPLSGVRVGDVDAVRTIMASFLLERGLGEMTEQERFFSGSALELGTALVLHAMEFGAPTLAHAARYYYDPAWTTDTQFFESLLKSEIPYVTETASKFGRMTEKQRSPIVATLTQQLDLFRTPDVARVTAGCSFDSSDLRCEPMTLYLVVRERDQPSLNPLMRMLLTRLLDDLTVAIPSEREQPILLLVDEFPLLRAPVIQRKLATMRKYKIHVALLAQTLSQIRSYYGQNESISGLCDVRVFFPSVDNATQDLASRTCGQTTRWGRATSSDAIGRASQSSHETGRPLLFPHELADLKATGEIIVAVKGEPPIRARPVRSHADSRFTNIQ
jgi:type IV secretion system protein VirD4